jgi:hypothetical protein
MSKGKHDMTSTQANENQETQAQRAADSPLKKPETETAKAQPADVAKAANGGEANLGNAQTLSVPDGTLKHSGPFGRTDETHEAIDVLNDDTLDNTVDADGKNRDAKAAEMLIENNPDAYVGVNATLVNAHAEQGDGFGGFDSRPARNGVALALESGFKMVDKGMIAPSIIEVEQQRDFVERDAHGDTLRGRKHYAVNHFRPSRLIEITPRDK